MSFARQMFGQVQRRAFSVSARQVSVMSIKSCLDPNIFQADNGYGIVLKSHRPRRCRWHRATSVAIDEAQPSCFTTCSLRYPLGTRSVDTNPQCEEALLTSLVNR